MHFASGGDEDAIKGVHAKRCRKENATHYPPPRVLQACLPAVVKDSLIDEGAAIICVEPAQGER